MFLFHDFGEQIYATSPVHKLKQNIKGESSTDAKSNVHRPQYSDILKQTVCKLQGVFPKNERKKSMQALGQTWNKSLILVNQAKKITALSRTLTC